MEKAGDQTNVTINGYVFYYLECIYVDLLYQANRIYESTHDILYFTV